MNELINTIQEIPLAALLPLAAALMLGLILWGAGKRVLRTSFAAIGFLIGFSLGWLGGEWMDIGFSPLVIGVILGVILGVLAIVLYRAALATTMAVIFAVASPLAVAAMYEWNGHPVFTEQEDHAVEAAQPEPDDLDMWLEQQRDEIINNEIRSHLPQFDEGFEEQLVQIRTYGERLIISIRDAWRSTDEAIRPNLIGAAVSGAVLGLILGGLLTGFSAAVVTAFGGSLLWISTMRVILERVGVGDLPILPATSHGWLMFWLVAAVIGLGIQWTFSRRSADKSGCQ